MAKCRKCKSDMECNIAYQGPNKRIEALIAQKYPSYSIKICKNEKCKNIIVRKISS